jgi:hypothetical protein
VSAAYPAQNSSYAGLILSSADSSTAGVTRYLRGSIPTLISFQATQVTYDGASASATAGKSSSTLQGYLLSYNHLVVGSTVSSFDFHRVDGLSLEFELERQLTTLAVDRKLKQTGFDVANAMLGALSGIIGLVAVAVGYSEMLENAVVNKFFPKLKHGTAEAQLEQLHEEYADRVRNPLRHRKASTSKVDPVPQAEFDSVAVSKLLPIDSSGGGTSSPRSPSSRHTVVEYQKSPLQAAAGPLSSARSLNGHPTSNATNPSAVELMMVSPGSVGASDS